MMTACIFVNKMVYDLYKVREKHRNIKKNYSEKIGNKYPENPKNKVTQEIDFDYIINTTLMCLATNPFIY